MTLKSKITEEMILTIIRIVLQLVEKLVDLRVENIKKEQTLLSDTTSVTDSTAAELSDTKNESE